MKRIGLLIGVILIGITGFQGNVDAYSDNGETVLQAVQKEQVACNRIGKAKKKELQKKQDLRNQYFSKSAFVGNSISVGLKMYFDSQESGYLGNPVMMVKGSYSFMNDKGVNSSAYQISYKGRSYRAKDAIKASKVKRVFINMGTNDLWKPVDQTYEDYVQYIEEIRKLNPKVVIFIQSTTPVCGSKARTYLNSSTVNELNRKMKIYCEKKKDMYYVDITKGMKDSGGNLNPKYASDGFVHMNMAGYEIWMDNLTDYVDALIKQEQDAVDAVRKAGKRKTFEDYQNAFNIVKKLKDSSEKDELMKKLKKVKNDCLTVDSSENG